LKSIIRNSIHLLAAAGLFFFAMATPGHGATSVNIPARSRLYDDFERLEVKGFLQSYMPATLPLDRAEGAVLYEEAALLYERTGGGSSDGAGPILKRLEKEFSHETSGLDEPVRFKPVELLYAGSLWARKDPYFVDVNNQGDEFAGGMNYRAGFVTTGSLFHVLSFYLNPEFRSGANDTMGRLVSGYVKLDLGGASLTVGRQSLWWGPGYHGGLLLTDNARPLDSVMLTSRHPFTLPWVLRSIGLIKPVIFVARLERDRFYPRANLLGMRLDVKPVPSFRFGLSRVIMFGGEGRRSLTFSDWMGVLTAADSAEHSSSPIDGDQILSVDASYVYVNRIRFLPLSGAKLYAEVGAEDSAGRDRTPKARAYLFGLLVDGPLWLDDFDLRVEYATTEKDDKLPAQQWYRHHIYKSGYTYYGRVIGHHMGPDASDIFVRLRYHHPSGAVVAMEADLERSDVNDAPNSARRSWLALDVDFPVTDGFRVSAGGGYEKVDGAGVERSSSPVAWLNLEYAF